MSETVNQEVATEEKTFTQAEVDAIVSDRLKRDRARYADFDAYKEKAEKYDTEVERGNALQTELDALKTANAIRDMKESVAKETGVPASLLTGTTEDDCRQQAEAILEYAKPKSYPNIRDGGEIDYRTKPTPKQQFAEWAEQAFR